MREHFEEIDGTLYDFEKMVDGMIASAGRWTPSDESVQLWFVVLAMRLMHSELKRTVDAAWDAWKSRDGGEPKNGPKLVS